MPYIIVYLPWNWEVHFKCQFRLLKFVGSPTTFLLILNKELMNESELITIPHNPRQHRKCLLHLFTKPAKDHTMRYNQQMQCSMGLLLLSVPIVAPLCTQHHTHTEFVSKLYCYLWNLRLFTWKEGQQLSPPSQLFECINLVDQQVKISNNFSSVTNNKLR